MYKLCMIFLFDGAIKKTTPAVVGFDISDRLHHVLRHPSAEFTDMFLKEINMRIHKSLLSFSDSAAVFVLFGEFLLLG